MDSYLIAVDMEGVHGVQGEKYVGQDPYFAIGRDTREYLKAVTAATDEVNTVAKSLFDNGANNVYLWDNHAARDNLFAELLDSRVKKVDYAKGMEHRLDFLAEIDAKGIIFIGYHSKASTLNGVLCHTYNGRDIQYVKINGKSVGEFDIDSIIASTFGVPSIFVASDDVCVGQVKEYDERVTTVITKIGKGRALADYRPTEVVLKEIYDGVKKAMDSIYAPKKAEFPMEVEIRYTKMEISTYLYGARKDIFGDRISFGEDANVLKVTVNDVSELRLTI